MDGRRNVIRAILGTGFAASIVSFLYPAVRFMMPPAVAESSALEVVAGQIADFPPNTGRIFKFGNRPGLLIRTEDGDWKAFLAVCTHLNCTVQYRPDDHRIWCACHNGLFDLNGQVAAGPPPRPLELFTVNLRGDDVVVTRAG
jgi:Rieske Fe-S protein